MYKVSMNEQEYEQFKKIVRIQMLQNKMTFADLAEKTGYSLDAIRHFFSTRYSKFIAYAIAVEMNLITPKEGE